MSKIISIKLTRIGSNIGPFNIYDQYGNVIAENVTKEALIEGAHYTVDDNVNFIKLVSIGKCTYEKVVHLTNITQYDFFHTPLDTVSTGCLWRHLRNPEIYNIFYGQIEPYVIEYSMSSPNTEIFQSFQDYSKVFKYTRDPYDVSNEPSKIELDD